MKISERLLIVETRVKDILLWQKIQIGFMGIILTAILAAWKSR